MKIKIIIMLLIATMQLASQTYEPTKVKMVYPYNSGDTIFLETNQDFIMKKYNLGWQWESGKAMTKNLKMNQIMPNIDFEKSINNKYITENSNLIIRSSIEGNVLSNSRAWHLKPKIQMNEFVDNDLSTLDPINGYIGFRNVCGDKSSTNRLLLAIGMTLPSDSIVLSDQLLSDRYLFNNNEKNSLDIISTDYNGGPIYAKNLSGEELYLSLNLRRTFIADNKDNSDTVLSVRVKYVNLPGTNGGRKSGHVKFNQYSKDTIVCDTLPQGRGLTKLMVNANNDSTFYITRRMLRRANETERDITLNAKMLFNSSDNFPDNYYLKGKLGIGDSLLIDSLIIEIKYYRRNSLGIDWVRIETKPAKDLYSGFWDDSLKSWINRDIRNTTSDTSDMKLKGNKPFRWYLKDEYTIDYWPTNRYFYKLFGPVFTSEMIPHYERMYEAYFAPQEKWRSIFSTTTCSLSPAYRYGNGGWNYFNSSNFFNYTLNQKGGFSFASWVTNIDTLNSFYETSILQLANTPAISIKGLRDTTFSVYEKYLGTFQLSILESEIYGFYFNHNRNGFLYSQLPWFGQFFSLVDWHRMVVFRSDSITKDTFAVHADYRPKTGEEIRLWTDNLMIMGAKGILLDGENTPDIKYLFEGNDPNFKGVTATKLGFLQSYYDNDTTINQNDPLGFILNDKVGTDFIVPNDFSKISSYINIDSSAKYLGVNKDRIYIGQKSNRLEIYKEFTKIRYTEEDLLQLKLIGWYGKGYKVLSNQDTAFQPNIISTIIDLDTNKLYTKRLWNPATQSIQHKKEAWDSSFFDITLMKYDTVELSKKFALGIQNRRSDPLIYNKDTIILNNYDDEAGVTYISTLIDSSLKFYTTAEFDNNCKSGGNVIAPPDEPDQWGGYYHYESFRDTNYWRNLFWRRLGCRQIRIPLSMTNIPEGEGYYLKVQELGVGTTLFNPDTCYWTSPLYYHKIDTTLYLNDTLISNLLPGQGKIVAFEVNSIFDDWCMDTLDCQELNELVTVELLDDDFINPNCCYKIRVTNTSNCVLDNLIIDINVATSPECLPSIMNSFMPLSNSFLMENPSPNRIRLIKRNTLPFQIDTIASLCIQDQCHFCLNFKLGRKVGDKYILCDSSNDYCQRCADWEFTNMLCCNTLEVFSEPIFDTQTQKNDYNIYALQNDTTNGKISKIIVTKKNKGNVIDKSEKNKNEKHIDLSIGKKIAKSKMNNSNGKDTLSVYFYDENDSLVCVKDLIIEEVQENDAKAIADDITESNTTDLSIRYYPNPVEELLNIEISSDICKKVKVKLLTLKSEELFNKEVKTNALNQFSTEGISNGVYFLKIEDCESDKFIIKKIVIKK